MVPAARFDRDATLFAAGRASVRPVARPLTALAFGLLALGQSARPPSPVAPPPAPEPIAWPAPSEPGPNYWALRDRVLRSGVGELDSTAVVSPVAEPPLRPWPLGDIGPCDPF